MRKTIIIFGALLLILSLTLSAGTGCASGGNSQPSQGLESVQQAWDIIFQDYVDKDKLDPSLLSQAAIKGMVEVLKDPYTSYMDAKAYQLGLTQLQGTFNGIGAYVGVKDNQPVIIAPIADSPAAKAGIKAGDIILAVDGQSTAGMSQAEVVLRIRGTEGTPVRLFILHQGETEPKEIEIIRAEIKVPSVRFEMKEDIAYINISHFSERTEEELLPTLKNIAQSGATGIILDLRSDPGGLLEAVIDVASYFLKEGLVVSVVDNRGQKTSSSVKTKEIKTDLPMVVLTDNYSASGSEVLAGALQDYGRATIAGTRTYGKGSVNILRQLKDGGGLYITTARWFTPKGRPLEGKGVEPDYELKVSGDDAILWAMDFLRGNKPAQGARAGGINFLSARVPVT